MSIIKAGLSRKGVQRFKDTTTGKVTLETSSRTPLGIKMLSTFLYMRGLSARTVGKIVGLHNTTILTYVKEFSDVLCSNIPINQQIIFEDVEIDELFTFLQKKTQNCTSGLQSTEKQEIL